jgi:hypothetical protein
VLPSGHLRVTHWIHSRAPVRTIRLQQPSVGQLGTLKLTRVVVAGDRAPAIRDVTRKDAYDVGGARNVYVSYELSGAVTRAPRPTGRALAVVTNLDVTGPPSPSLVTHAVLGARILNLACSTASPAAVPTPCGTPDRSGWHVTLDESGVTDRVMAQVDLDADAAG